MPNNNKKAIPGTENALDSLKYEIANEIGITNYAQVDKGSLPSRENGRIGGNMVKRMIQFAESNMHSGL